MTFLKTHLHTILLIALGVFIALGIKSCVTKIQKPDKMIRNEVEIENLQKQVPALIRERDSIRAAYDSLISLSQTRFNDLEKQKQPIKYVIQNTPVIISNYDKEQLRRAINSGN